MERSPGHRVHRADLFLICVVTGTHRVIRCSGKTASQTFHQPSSGHVMSLVHRKAKLFLGIKLELGPLQTFQWAGWGFQEPNPAHTPRLKEPEHLRAWGRGIHLSSCSSLIPGAGADLGEADPCPKGLGNLSSRGGSENKRWARGRPSTSSRQAEGRKRARREHGCAARPCQPPCHPPHRSTRTAIRRLPLGRRLDPSLLLTLAPGSLGRPGD